jgi:TolA-binding protein
MPLFAKKSTPPAWQKHQQRLADQLSLDRLGEELIEQGAQVIKDQIEAGVQSVIDLDGKNKLGSNLKPEEFLSDQLLLNESVPAKVKAQVEQRRETTRAVVLSIAHEIETRHFRSAEEAIGQIDILSHQRERIQAILQSQKQINYSFRTLEVLIGVFQRYNADLLQRMSDSHDLEKSLRLRMENALMVYELLDFAHQSIEHFVLNGVEELRAIKTEVFAEIKEVEKEQRQLVRKLKKTSDHAQQSIMKTVEDRKQVFDKMRERWDDMEGRVEAVIHQVKEVKKILPDLDAYRLNAKIHIKVLSLVAIMNMVEKNLEIVERFAEVDWDLLAPFEPDDYLALVGEHVQEQNAD